jgi:hypothetical protein
VWVPGYTWAPAWVSWRSNDDYVGWAPLPPEARWRVGFGFGGWVDSRFDIGPGFYSFVGVGDFGAPALGAVILDRSRNVTIINNTTNITNITNNNGNVYTGGPKYAAIAARSTRPIPTLKLVRQGSPGALKGANGKFLAHQQGSQLVVLAPKVTAPEGKAPAPAKVTKTLTGVKADNGWAGTDPSQRQALESKFKSEPTAAYTPAKSVKAEDLKVVTEKATKTPEVTKPVTAGETPKPKNKKSLSELENATATEEPGSTPAPTPKAEKTKKSHEEGEENASPTPKKHSKKAKTPSDEETDAVKHNQGDESGLQPFMGGNEEKTEKPKNEEYSGGGGGGGDHGPTNNEEKKKKKGKGSPTPPE